VPPIPEGEPPLHLLQGQGGIAAKVPIPTGQPPAGATPPPAPPQDKAAADGDKDAGKTKPVQDKANVSSRGLSLKYDDADLFDFIDVVSSVLELNYIIDPAVSGKVNINMNKPVPKEALMPIFIDILRINGATIVKSGDVYHIVPITEGKKYPSEIKKIDFDYKVEGSELSTYIIPVEFMPSGDLSKILDEFKTDKTQIINYEVNNILIITDFKDNLVKLLELIKILDHGYFEVNRVELISMKFNKAEDVAKDLEVVFSSGNQNSGIKFIAIPRMNSVLAVCRTPNALETIYRWVEKLDAPTAFGLETFVYKVENTTATNIADILSQLFADMGAKTSTVGGQRPVATGEGGLQATPPSQSGTPVGGQTISPQLRGSLKGGDYGPIQGLSGGVKIIVDDLNNNLIIQGTQADYEFLLRTIKKLDVLPRQVLIEAKVMRVDLTGGLSMGVSYWLQKRTPDRYPATVGHLDSGGLNLSTVVTFGLNNGREVNMIIDALESMSKVQVMESPAVLVLDGNEANINVGKEIPIATGVTSNPYLSNNTDATTGNLSNTQIQYRSTGVNLGVAPRISSSGIVTLEIAVEVSTPGNKDEGLAGSPPINRASVNTTMVVQDGSSVVIAGLISDTFENSRSSVPFVGHIPILGWLFSTTSENTNRSELLVVLTPKVIHTAADASATSTVVVNSLENINKYIEKKKKDNKYGILQEETLRQLQAAPVPAAPKEEPAAPPPAAEPKEEQAPPPPPAEEKKPA